MKAFREDLVIEQGATFDKTWKWVRTPKKLAVDLAGCTGRMHIRPSVASPDILLALTTENGYMIFGEGTIQLLVPFTITTDLNFSKGVYDLEIVQTPAGRVRRLLEGEVTFTRNVTR